MNDIFHNFSFAHEERHRSCRRHAQNVNTLYSSLVALIWILCTYMYGFVRDQFTKEYVVSFVITICELSNVQSSCTNDGCSVCVYIDRAA